MLTVRKIGERRISDRHEPQNKAGEATVYLYSDIGGWFGADHQEWIKEFNAIDAGTIHLRIDSSGGDIFAARAMKTAIMQHKANVIAHIDGLAASAASFLAMGANEVEIVDGGFLMIHNAMSFLDILGYFNAKELDGLIKDLGKEKNLHEKINDSIADDYAKRSGKDRSAILAWMEAETWFTAKEAVENGLADRVYDGELLEGNYDLSIFAKTPDSIKDRVSKTSKRTLEKALRDACLSRAEAKKILAEGFSDDQRDAETEEAPPPEKTDQRDAAPEKPKKDRVSDLLTRAEIVAPISLTAGGKLKMKTMTQYREDIRNLMKKAADIDAKCVNEAREITEAELALKNELLDTVEDLNKIVASMQRQDRIQRSLEEPEKPKTAPAPQNKSNTSRREDREQFSSFGEQMSAVMRAGMPGGQVDPRLFNAATGLGESVSSDGGFLVQQDFSSVLLEEVFNTGVLASRCNRIPISGNSNGIKIPGFDETSRASTRFGGVVAYWKDEAAQKTASKPKFRMIELNLKKLIGLCYATDELIQDAAALESYIQRSFVSEFGFQVDDAIINGTGAGTPLGILQSGCLVSVGKETGQDAATILAENVIKMYSRMFASSLSSAEWYINQNILPQLLTMSVAVGTGGIPVYLPPGNTLVNAPGGALLGRPVTPIEQAATLGTQGDIIFADLKNGYIMAEKGGIQSDMSIHVQFIYDESVFRFVLRVDGQPVRASALTPYKGGSGATQSHFITLDTRA